MKSNIKFKLTPSQQVNIAAAFFIFAMFISCDSSDDNNPSPVPDVREKFVGSWNVTEDCAKGNYIASIEKDPSNSAQLLLFNFADSKSSEPDTAIAVSDKAAMYGQTNSEGWLLEGIGTYQDDGTIVWEFSLVVSGFAESCTATYSPGK